MRLLRKVLAVILGLIIINGALLATVFQHKRIGSLVSDEDDVFRLQELQLSTWMSPAWSLVEETRAALKRAGGVPGISGVLSSSESANWDEAHPCVSRLELLPLWLRQRKAASSSTRAGDDEGEADIGVSANGEPSGVLGALFQEYSNLHRTCTHGGDMAYVARLYQSGNQSHPCQFLVVEFGTYGVGNRLLWLVSAYLYALLTKRVILIDTRSTVHSLLCEPFPGSSWRLPKNFPYSSVDRWPMPSAFQEVWDPWRRHGIEKRRNERKERSSREKNWGRDGGLRELTLEAIERERREARGLIQSRVVKLSASGTVEAGRSLMGHEKQHKGPSFHHVQANDGWAPNPRFYCDDEQRRLNLVKWVSLNSGCLYFLPGLFAVPSFQPALEELFPYRDPLTHLLRQFALPVDSIWKNVKHVYARDFEAARKVVGVQVRYRDGSGMYTTLNDIVNARITGCAIDHGLIPSESASTDDPVAGDGLSGDRVDRGPVLIFIASLYRGLHEHLDRAVAKALKKSEDSSRPPLKILQLSSLGFQSFDLDADYQAVTEILLLSLTDQLMTSPQSTYGQMAQAYGGLYPWLIDFSESQEEGARDCVRGQSTDACYQFPISVFSCPFNKEVDGRPVVAVAPYLKPCQDTDGLQLVSPWVPTVVSSGNST